MTASLTDSMLKIVKTLNDPLWEWLVYLLLGTGLFYTVTTGFVQIRLFGRSIKEMLGGRTQGDDPHGITPFQAFVTGLASRVGVGNIGGVAIAISLGGPGAVFWMWLTALLGMSSAFAESSLAQLFKVRDHHNGQFRGGPAYYITRGLKSRWLGILFALSLILAFGFVFNAVQANAIVAASQAAWNWNAQIVGVCLVIMTAPIIFGGIRRVSHVAEAVVPIMAMLYLLMAIWVIITHIDAVPSVISLIFTQAFTYDAAAGGFLGGMMAVMMQGIQRGLFSNEAGMGSAPNAAAAADVKHPVSQGMIQMLGVFVDTMVVCSCTAFILLLSNVPYSHTELTGVQLTQAAIESYVGSWGADFLAVLLFLFAYSSIIGNYAYAESNMQFIKNSKTAMTIFRMIVLGMVYFGSVTKVQLVWNMADLSMGIMSLINLIAILLLSPLVFLLLKDYRQSLKTTNTPRFDISQYPEVQKRVKSDVW